MKVVVCPTKLLQILRENTCFVTAPFFMSLTLCMMLWPQNQERGTARTRLVLMNTAADVTNQIPQSKFNPQSTIELNSALKSTQRLQEDVWSQCQSEENTNCPIWEEVIL